MSRDILEQLGRLLMQKTASKVDAEYFSVKVEELFSKLAGSFSPVNMMNLTTKAKLPNYTAKIKTDKSVADPTKRPVAPAYKKPHDFFDAGDLVPPTTKTQNAAATIEDTIRPQMPIDRMALLKPYVPNI